MLALSQLAHSVESEADFVAFAEALLQDWRDEVEQEKTMPIKPSSPGPNGWENGTIEAFLDAMIAWQKDSVRGPLDRPPSWKAFALLLLAGSRYE